MRPGRWETAFASIMTACAAAGALASTLAAAPAAAQTAATALAMPPFGYFGSSLLTRDLGPPAREAEFVNQVQMQQLDRALSDLARAPPLRPACGGRRAGADRDPAASAALPACLPAPQAEDLSERDLGGLQAGPPR